MAEEPAFPVITWGRPDGLEMMQFQAGMTKRELIAMHAMAAIVSGICSNGPFDDSDAERPRAFNRLVFDNAAADAAMLADALLAALGEQS